MVALILDLNPKDISKRLGKWKPEDNSKRLSKRKPEDNSKRLGKQKLDKKHQQANKNTKSLPIYEKRLLVILDSNRI